MAKPLSGPSLFGTDTLVDSEDLMSWLLLNPEMDFEAPPPNWTGDDIGLPPISSGFDETSFDAASLGHHDAIGLVSSSASHSSPSTATKPRVDTNAKESKGVKRSASAAKISSTSSGSAGAAKKRARESVEDLEARVNALKSENADLHAHLLNVTQRTTEVQKQRIAMEKLMAVKLSELGDRNDGDQSELAQLVKQYTDIYADYGKCRQREVAFHLQQLEKLIVPTSTTKMCLWTLQQDKSFYQPNKSPMYDILSKELDISADQAEKILERRTKITGLLHQLRECLQLLKSLKVAIEKKHACYDNICGRVQSAASPKQIVQFQMWIGRNAELLAKFVPGFNRTSSYIPSAQFVEPDQPLISMGGINPPGSSLKSVASLGPMDYSSDDSDTSNDD